MNWRNMFRRSDEREQSVFEMVNVDPSRIIHPDKVSLGIELGRGGFAKAFHCEWNGMSAVAKIIKVGKMNEETRKLLSNECDIWSRLSHSNIVSLYGISSASNSLVLVCEYFAGGALLARHQSLLDSRAALLDQEEVAKMLKQVVSGMAYLHDFDPPVLHRDLKSANILLSRDGDRLAIGDFGLARYQSTDRTMTAETGSYRWMAPEVVRHESYNTACDVYSFAILAWEMLTYRIPFEDCTPVQAALAVAKNSRQLLIPDQYKDTDIEAIVTKCWHPQPSQRPSFAHLLIAL